MNETQNALLGMQRFRRDLIVFPILCLVYTLLLMSTAHAGGNTSWAFCHNITLTNNEGLVPWNQPWYIDLNSSDINFSNTHGTEDIMLFNTTSNGEQDKPQPYWFNGPNTTQGWRLYFPIWTNWTNGTTITKTLCIGNPNVNTTKNGAHTFMPGAATANISYGYFDNFANASSKITMGAGQAFTNGLPNNGSGGFDDCCSYYWTADNTWTQSGQLVGYNQSSLETWKFEAEAFDNGGVAYRANIALAANSATCSSQSEKMWGVAPADGTTYGVEKCGGIEATGAGVAVGWKTFSLWKMNSTHLNFSTWTTQNMFRNGSITTSLAQPFNSFISISQGGAAGYRFDNLRAYSWYSLEQMKHFNMSFGPQFANAAAASGSGEIRSYNRANDTLILVYNATIYNATTTFVLNTTNGTITTGLASDGSIFTFNISRGDYLPTTHTTNLSLTFIDINMSQSILNINVTEIITNITLGPGGNNLTNLFGKESNRTLSVNAGCNNVTFSRSGYITETRTICGIVAATNTTYNWINAYTTLLNITAHDQFDTSIITDFNITITNGSHTFNFTTNNGRIAAGVLNATWNITYSSGLTSNASLVINAENRTHLINFSVTSAWIDAYVFEKVSGNNISGYIMFAPQFSGANSSNGTLSVKTGLINITISKSPYYNLTRELNIPVRGNHSVLFENLSYATLNFSGRNSSNNVVITEFYVNISAINLTYRQIVATNNGTLQVQVINGSYEILIVPNMTGDNTLATRNFTYTVNASFHNINVTFPVARTLRINFVDERTNVLINFTNVTLEMISELAAYNFTTGNGTLMTSILTPTEYRLRYSSPLHSEKSFFLTISPNSADDTTLYMINASIETDVTITISDTAARPITGQRIQVLRYDLQSNTYRLVEVLESNTLGQATAHMQVNAGGVPGEFYKFIVLIDGVVKLETVPQYITTNSISLTVPTTTTMAETFYKTLNVSVSLIFNNNTDQFRYTYVDPTAQVSQGCLQVYKITGNTQTLHNITCSNSTSATILLAVTNQSSTTWKGVATIKYPTTSAIPIGQVIYTSNLVETLGNIGAFMMIIIILVLFFAGIWNPIVAITLCPLALIFASYAGLTAIPLWVGMGLQAVFLAIGFMLGDRA